MLEQLDNSNISKHLGKSSVYIRQYDKNLLVREPRASNRKHLKIDDAAPPFVGYDVWNGYEVSALCDNGLPVAGVADLAALGFGSPATVLLPAENPFLNADPIPAIPPATAPTPLATPPTAFPTPRPAALTNDPTGPSSNFDSTSISFILMFVSLSRCRCWLFLYVFQ